MFFARYRPALPLMLFMCLLIEYPSAWASKRKPLKFNPPPVTSLVLPENRQTILLDSKTLEMIRRNSLSLSKLDRQNQTKAIIKKVVARFSPNNLDLTSAQESAAYIALMTFDSTDSQIDSGFYHIGVPGITMTAAMLITIITGFDWVPGLAFVSVAAGGGSFISNIIYKGMISDGTKQLESALKAKGITFKQITLHNAEALLDFLGFAQMKMHDPSSIQYFSETIEQIINIMDGQNKRTPVPRPDVAFRNLILWKYRIIADLQRLSSELKEMDLSDLIAAYQTETKKKPPLDFVRTIARERSAMANLNRSILILNNFGMQVFDPKLVELLEKVEELEAEYDIDVSLEHVAGSVWKLMGVLSVTKRGKKLEEKITITFNDSFGYLEGKTTPPEVIIDFQKNLGEAASKLLVSLQTTGCANILDPLHDSSAN